MDSTQRSTDYKTNGDAPFPPPQSVRRVTASHTTMFAQQAPLVLANGYSPLPIKPKSKIPQCKWTRLRTRPLTAHEIDDIAARYPNAGLGVACGYNGLVAVDVDTDDDEIVAVIMRVLPDPLVTKRGKRGFTLLYRDPSGSVEARKFKSRHDDMLVEVLASGNQTVIPPTNHPETACPYEWLTECTLINTGIELLPELPPDIIERLEKALTPWLPETRAYTPPRTDGSHPPVSDKRMRTYAEVALKREAQALAARTEGGRNHDLYRLGLRIGKYVHHGVLSKGEVESAVLAAAKQNGLLDEDGRYKCLASLASGLRKAENDHLPNLEASEFNAPHGGKRMPSTKQGKGGYTNGAAHDGGDFAGDSMSARKEIPTNDSTKANGVDSDPLPLIVRESRDDKFPIDALGPHLKSAVCALQAVNQTPIEMAANSVLGVISLACQTYGDIQFPIAAGPSPISLYLLTIAESGERKSANDNLALKAVRVYQNELREAYREDFAKFKNRHAIWSKGRDAILSDKGLAMATKEDKIAALGPEPPPPISPLIVFSDPTIQAIVKQLCQHRPSLGVFSSEAAIFLSGYSMGGDGKLNAAGILCETWDGRGPSNLRAGDGETANPGCRLAMHLAAQRNVAQKFLGDADLREQGTLSRFLVVDPESTMGTRFWKEPAPEDMEKLAKFDATILSILRRPLPIKPDTRNELVPTAFEIADDARVLWVAFHDEVERALAPGGLYEPIKGIAAKLAENAGRLAACIAMYEHEASGGNAPLPQVGIDSFKQGIELARFYARTALRLVDAEEPERALTTAEKVLRFLHEKGEDFGWLVCLPEIYQKGPGGIRKTATAREAMRVLEEHRHVKRMPAQVVREHFRQEVWKIVEPNKTPAKVLKR